MSSSTATISSKNSTMNNNDRKRPISSSIRPSPSPPSAKRHGLSTSNSRRSERNEILLKKNIDQNERQSRSKQQYRHIDNKSSSSESSRSSSNSNHSLHQEYTSSTLRTIDIKNSNKMVSTKKPHLNSMNNSNNKSDLQTDTIYTKKATSFALIVKPSTTIEQRNGLTNYDSDEEFERTKQISNKVLTKSTHVVVPSSVMTIVTTPDLSKNSMRTDNVIIQQIDGTLNPNSSTKLVKLVVPPSTATAASSIKMLSSGDSLASALRVPAKIQLTKPLFVSSGKTNKSCSSLISSITTQQQFTLSPSSLTTTLLDIPIDMTDKQESNNDYQSSTTLPPTPPPPVIDNTNSNIRNVLSHTSISQLEEQQKINEISTVKAIEQTNSSTHSDHSNDEITPKFHSLSIDHSSLLSDWSVPPTSELSPTSLTSSSPDLTQNHLPSDDSFNEFNSKLNSKRSTKRRCRSLSFSFPSTKTVLQPMKSKSLTRLSDSSDMKFMLIHNKRSLTSSPIIKLSSSQRIRKRRRDNENFLLNQQNEKLYKSKTKLIKIEYDNQFIIKDLLNDIIEQIVSMHNPSKTCISQDNTVLPRPIAVSKKSYSSSQSFDSTKQTESRSMIMTQRELDELAYLLHANVHRGEFERITNPTKVEERMREMWSQMSMQKKNSYYKRVIQIYKRPNRDVVIASSSTIENHDHSVSNEFKRQTSTPLSFHSIPSSTPDEQSIISPLEFPSKTNLFTDIVNELIKGAKGLDKLSCSPTDFINSIQTFVRSTIDKQIQTVHNLEQQVEKKCSTQLNRATIFWTQKIQYFATKYPINSSNESMNELTLIVKYFYLLVLSLNCRKQEIEFETSLTDLINGNLTFINPTFCSVILTNIIEDLILYSTLANDYLASQPLIIDHIEHSLPLIRNIDLENDLLNKNETYLITNPFSDFNDLEDYLNRCEHITTAIPSYPTQQSHHPPMYYPPYHPPPQYYYPPPQTPEMNNYYYNPQTPTYPNSPSIYPYSQSSSYYQTYNNNEQFKYYYNPQSSYTYSSQTNSTNDIPLANNNPSIHRTYRQMSSNIPKTYSNSQQQPTTPSTPAVFDTTTVVSPQSKSINTTNNTYPP